MPRIPARYGWLVMPAILALLMTCVVSGISTLRAIGFTPDFASKWLGAWLISYVVAYPTLILVQPVVRRIMAAIMTPPPAPPR
jgi:hypothetical protein